MSTIIQTTVYQFDELNDKAKDKAREWFREASSGDDLDYVVDDAVIIAKLLGITFDPWDSKIRSRPRIYWSGFWSQGDGACFEGSYAYAKGACKKIREHAPEDATLHKIADELQELQRKAFYRLEARAEHRGHYYHSGCMRVEVFHAREASEEDGIARQLRAVADWIYRRLEEEYEWRNADEQVDDSLRANEYTFTEDGRRFG